MSVLITSIPHFTDDPRQHIKANKIKDKQIRKEKVKLLLFIHHMISYGENHKVSTRKMLLALIS